MKTLILIPLVLVVSGCASTNSNKYCETPVRDLTQDWHSRTYWCLPKGYVPLIEPQTSVSSPAPSQVSSRVPFDTSVITKVEPKSETRVLYTEHESLQHKVRVISPERPVISQTSKATPILTTKQKEKGIELVDAIKPTNEAVKSSSDITSFDVSFTKHNLDTDFSKSDLSKIVGAVSKTDVIKLQGCRQGSEIESLVLGRALAVRQALIREGVDNKIVILSNQSCTTDKKVKVNV